MGGEFVALREQRGREGPVRKVEKLDIGGTENLQSARRLAVASFGVLGAVGLQINLVGRIEDLLQHIAEANAQHCHGVAGPATGPGHNPARLFRGVARIVRRGDRFQ